MRLYVAGPKIEKSVRSPFNQIYATIERFVESLPGASVWLPYTDSTIDQLAARPFAQAIRNRIAESDAVLSLADARSTNVGVESGIASELQKPIGVVLLDPAASLPRVLVGLPTVVISSTLPQLDDALRALLVRRPSQA